MNRRGYSLEMRRLSSLALRRFSGEAFTGHRLVFSEYGDPSQVIRKERFNLPTLPSEHLVAKVLAAPVNPADMNTIQGTYPAKPPSLPATGGNEGVGVVVKLPTSSPAGQLQLGDWVIPGGKYNGTWQAYISGPPQQFLKVSNEMDLVSAASLSVNPCTAYRLLKDFETLKPGDCVIQNGGNSAVGQAVIQLCREWGLKSVSLVRPREDFEKVKASLLALGNADTIIITDENLRGMMRDFKAQLALNSVGGKSATDILRVLESGRTMVTYGGMSRQPVIVPTSHLIFNDVKLRGFWMSRWNSLAPRPLREEMLEYLSALSLKGHWTPPPHKLVPLAKYREALENTMKGYSGLKYILIFD